MCFNAISDILPPSMPPKSADPVETKKNNRAQYAADSDRAEQLFAQPLSCDPKTLATQMREILQLSRDVHDRPLMWWTAPRVEHKMPHGHLLLSRMQLFMDDACRTQMEAPSPRVVQQLQSQLTEGRDLLRVLLQKAGYLAVGSEYDTVGPGPAKAPGNMFSLCELLEDLRTELEDPTRAKHESLRQLAETLPRDPWADMHDLDALSRYSAIYLNAKAVYDKVFAER